MKETLVTNIQRFSLHDGPGIRTTVFMKGCSLHCPWCANPENLLSIPEKYIKDGKMGVYGEYLSCKSLYKKVINDRIFYDQKDESAECGFQKGGVTFSGGEPLLQFDVLEPLLAQLKSENIHICVETCLFVPKNKLLIAMKYVDLFYVDIKILDDKKCKKKLGGVLKQYCDNLKVLFDSDKLIVIRVPIIGGFTDDEKNIDRIIKILNNYPPIKVELIKEHNLGANKYVSLGKKPLTLNSITDKKMEQIKFKIFERTGLPVEICKI